MQRVVVVYRCLSPNNSNGLAIWHGLSDIRHIKDTQDSRPS